MRRGRPLGVGRKDECVNGHPLVGDNVALVQRTIKGVKYKERQCRSCRNQRSREWRKRVRDAKK